MIKESCNLITDREQIELIRSRAKLLRGHDRMLMKLYLENNASLREMSSLTSISPGSISRRLHRITDRLTDGPYVNCLRNRRKYQRYELEVAKDHFVLNLSIRQISKKRNLSSYMTRKIIEKVKGIVRSE